LNESGIAYERPKREVPIRFTRIGSTAAPLEMKYALDGTAINGTDYDLIPLAATIPVGSSFVDVVIAPISDALLEGDELVELRLLPSESYILEGNTNVLLTIQEDVFHSSPHRIQFGFRWGGGTVIQQHGEHG